MTPPDQKLPPRTEAIEAAERIFPCSTDRARGTQSLIQMHRDKAARHIQSAIDQSAIDQSTLAMRDELERVKMMLRCAKADVECENAAANDYRAQLSKLREQLAAQSARVQALEAEVKLARTVSVVAMEALEFYANPENYSAIGFLCDRPCGAFADDGSDDHGHPHYDRRMPGKTARAAIKRLQDAALSQEQATTTNG